jgi:hypothetical protein
VSGIFRSHHVGAQSRRQFHVSVDLAPRERFTPWGHLTPRLSVTGGFLVALAIAALTAGCDSPPANPQLQWGWITNCAGPEFSRFGSPGPGPDRPVFKISNELVLAVQKRYGPNGNRINREPVKCNTIGDLPAEDFLQFHIQGNWSDGYKPEDIPTQRDGRKQFRPDIVWVRIEPQRPSTLAPEEEREVDQISKDFHRKITVGTRQIGGLTCDISKYLWNNANPDCFGNRSEGDPDVTRVRLKLDTPATHFVLIQADYLSSKYGGIRVYWQTWTSEVSHWRDIDTAVIKNIADWNLLSRE